MMNEFPQSADTKRFFGVALFIVMSLVGATGVRGADPSRSEAPDTNGNVRGPDAKGSKLRIVSVDPTVLFTTEDSTLLQVVSLMIENGSEPLEASVQVNIGAAGRSEVLGKISKGRGTFQIHVPDTAEPTLVEFVLKAEGEIQDRHAVTWQPQRHWEVYRVPIEHHDWGYTAPIEDVERKYCDIYDRVLLFCDETQDWPDEAKYRHTVEGTWSIQHFIRNRPPEVVAKLARYVQERRIEIPALFGNEISGMCGHEELVRLLYPSFRLKQELGATISTASITDIPGLSWGLPTVLADAGVSYFFAGLPTYFEWDGLNVPKFWDEAAILPHGTPDAFWWEGPDGRKVLVYYSGGYGCWRPNSYDKALSSLPGMLRQLEAKGCPFSVVRYGARGCGDNSMPDICDIEIARDWNRRWAYPRMIVATNAMFFEALGRQCQNVRTFRGELPHTDYVVGAASMAKETGINRMTRDRLPSAEKFATIAGLLDHSPSPLARINGAYDSLLLYDEHTWGVTPPAGPVEDWDWSDKALRAYRAAGMTDILMRAGLERIVDRIGLDQDGPHIAVFNPLAVVRTDVVRAALLGWPEIPEYVFQGRFDLIDVETGERVPSQMVEVDSPQAPVPFAAHRYAMGHVTNHTQGDPSRYRDHLFEVAFLATDVPAMGYKTYRVVPRADVPASNSGLMVGENTIENRFFKITLDPRTGGVRSILDKSLSRELVDADAPHKLNQLVVRWVKDHKEESAQGVTIERGVAGPVFGSLLVKAQGPACPELTQEIVLYDGIKRIDFNNRLLKNSTPHVEIYFAFPFKMDRPRFRFEASDSVIRPFEDQFPGSNSNYYSVQHWADVSDGRASITLSPIEAHLLEFGGLWPCRVSHAHHGVTPPDYAEPFVTRDRIVKGHMYSFALDSNFRTNFQPVQQGDMLFRYSVTTHAGEWPEDHARDFGWAIANPLIAMGMNGKQEGKLGTKESFCRVEPSSVVLTTFKQAEDGQGFILRLIETEGRSSVAKVSVPRFSISKAYRTNVVEENQAELTSGSHEIEVPVRAFGITTIRLAM